MDRCRQVGWQGKAKGIIVVAQAPRAAAAGQDMDCEALEAVSPVSSRMSIHTSVFIQVVLSCPRRSSPLIPQPEPVSCLACRHAGQTSCSGTYRMQVNRFGSLRRGFEGCIVQSRC